MVLQKKVNLAFLVPGREKYSETFIRAQKELLPYNIETYYGGFFPTHLEGGGNVINPNIIAKSLYILPHFLGSSDLNFQEYQLQKSFKSNDIDVVLAQFGPTGEAVARVCQVSNIPLVVHFHGMDAFESSLIKKHNGYARAFQVASRVVCVSQAMRRQLSRLGCPSDKLSYNTYGPRDCFFDVNACVEQKHFIALGRFTDKKAPYYSILAFSKVLLECPEARFTIGGDGELLNTCKNLVRALGLQHAVTLPGILTKQEFFDHLQNSAAFVQHSITADNGDSEGTPLSILEASAAGLPVVSTKHAGIPDVIEDGVTGILVEEHDVNGMAEAMINLLQDKRKAQEMGKCGKVRIREYFSMDRHIKGLAAIIDDTL